MNSLFVVSPALAVSFGCIAVLMAGLWVKNHAAIVGLSLASLIGAGGLLVSMIGKPGQDAFAGLIVFDSLGLFFSIFVVVAVTFGIFLSSGSNEIKPSRRSEYYSILLALVSGLIFMSISNHFLMIYLAIETVSILSYTLAGFNRERSASAEASLKYVVYGSMASAIMVFGMSLLYGVTGALELTEIRNFVAATPVSEIPTIAWIAVLFIFAGVGYKISAAPMHMWTPDVYEGAPTPVSAILSVAPKAAGFALLIRIFVTAFSLPLEGQDMVVAPADAMNVGFQIVGPFNWPRFLMISSVFTMFMGNLAALAQISVKRILAYSSIAHAGYALMGAATQSHEGLVAILFYLMIYCLMNLGAFWVTSRVEDAYGNDHLKSFKGLSTKQPFYAVVMGIFLFSLIGIPPFAGFAGKFYLFSAVIKREMYGFAILAVLNSVISLYYYAKVLKAMFLEQPESGSLPTPAEKLCFKGPINYIFLTILVVPNIVLGLYWEPIFQVAKGALNFYIGK